MWDFLKENIGAIGLAFAVSGILVSVLVLVRKRKGDRDVK